MRLAEALAQRADLMRRAQQLKARAVGNARHQEGENPVEDPNELLVEHDHVIERLEWLITRINATNLATELEPGTTLTAALARRDTLRLRHNIRVDLADAASVRQDRYTRSELRAVPAVQVRQLRQGTDDIAREARTLDTRIQEVNWATELLG